jgi:hypothetical protein
MQCAGRGVGVVDAFVREQIGVSVGGQRYGTANCALVISFKVRFVAQCLFHFLVDVEIPAANPVACSMFIPPKPFLARYVTHTTLASSLVRTLVHEMESGSRIACLILVMTNTVRTKRFLSSFVMTGFAGGASTEVSRASGGALTGPQLL